MLGCKRFATAQRVLAGVEAVGLLTKGQVRGVRPGETSAQRTFVHQLLGLAA